MKMVYGDLCSWKQQKNKPNSNPIVFFTAENAEFAEQKRICVSDCPIKKYNKLLLGDLRALGG
jgi:hypothetical protein